LTRSRPAGGHDLSVRLGFIPETLAEDGDPLDAIVLLDAPLQTGSTVKPGSLTKRQRRAVDAFAVARARDAESRRPAIARHLDDPEPLIPRITRSDGRRDRPRQDLGRATGSDRRSYR
jgi:inorganic pyrophosphatase